tara:strand:+ start:28 stop:618 length:591 start_codon:yes stop_codon:yes gene_type:complete
MKNYFKATSENIDIAIKYLNEKKLIIHSTDTIPGLAADATNDNAVQALIKLKGRPGPYSIIVNSLKEIQKFALVDDNKIKKINSILPGPFTVLLKNNYQNDLSQFVLGNSDLIGFRIPNHSFSNKLVLKFKKPIITTSLNLTGEESIINLEKVSEHFKELVIFDDEKRKSSKGSTILNFSSKNVSIIRKGDGEYTL